MATNETPITTTEAGKSAALFVARIASQVAVARTIVEGCATILNDQVSILLASNIVGWLTLALAGLIIFWGQFGYQLAEAHGWKWAANLKWPF